MRRTLLTLGAWMLVTTSSSCIAGFESPSAYEDYRFLCSEDAWLERVEACRERRDDEVEPCGGVVSLTGNLESQSITLSTDLVTGTFAFNEMDNGVFALNSVSGVGPSPYFTLTFKLESLGGTVFTPMSNRVLAIDQGARGRDGHLLDTAANVSLRLTTGGDSVVIGGLTDSGEIGVGLQSFIEIEGRFEGDFGTNDDRLEGCFHLFALESTLTCPGGSCVFGRIE